MSSVIDFYKGRTIFITGATGYMGKVLLEKIVRIVPDLAKIYILIRAKKDVSPEERVKRLTSDLIFTFNNIDKKSLDKIVAVSGDITKENLGLSECDKQKLIDEVSVVFHLAASIRMDLRLKEAVITNTKSTYEVFKLCMKIKKLVSVVHLSTAYCNVEISYMEEKVYPVNVNPYKIIDMVEWMDEKCLAAIEDNIISPHPNTYTFTKRLSEVVVSDMGKTIPLIIARPSIVLPALCEPTPGWVDNYYGPIGIFVAGGKGVARSALVNPNVTPQAVPVDIAINGLIVSGYERATHLYFDTPVINLSQGQRYQMTWQEVVDFEMNLALKYPFKKMLWYPRTVLTKNYYLHLCLTILFHFVPALVVDFLMIMFLQKPFLFSIQQRLLLASKVLYHFAVKEWNFSNTKATRIANDLDIKDSQIFYGLVDVDIDLKKYLTDMFFATRKYLLKEDLENLGTYRVLLKILYVLDASLKLIFCFWAINFVGNMICLLFWK